MINEKKIQVMDIVRLMFLQGNLFPPQRQIESLTSQLESLLSTVECVESLTFEQYYPFVRAPVKGLNA